MIDANPATVDVRTDQGDLAPYRPLLVLTEGAPTTDTTPAGQPGNGARHQSADAAGSGVGRARSGRALDDLTLEQARTDGLGLDDVRIDAAGLLRQAATADLAGNPQLADNLRLAAELATLPDAEMLGLYDLLRPGGATLEALNEAVSLLEQLSLPRAARLFREAAGWYTTRGLLG